jgi:hypothetical protein
MVESQLEVLKKHSRELGKRIFKLNRKGKTEASYKMKKKRATLDASIEQVTIRG